MVYNTIESSNSTNNKGLLMILDFSKAFDKIEWPFIIQRMNILNFGENFTKMINLFQFNCTSRVEQNGYLSAPITLSRGRMQGDPFHHMSLYFVQRYDEEFKTSQYADDTTLFVAEDINSIRYIMKVLK